MISKKSYFKSGMHFVAGNPVRPALTSARYSLCLRRISSLRSGRFLKPRPLTATPSGHCGPIPQYLQAVCKSPPYQASQYFCLVSSLQIGFSTYYGKKNIKHIIEIQIFLNDCHNSDEINHLLNAFRLKKILQK